MQHFLSFYLLIGMAIAAYTVFQIDNTLPGENATADRLKAGRALHPEMFTLALFLLAGVWPILIFAYIDKALRKAVNRGKED